jgi:hypothetical protein
MFACPLCGYAYHDASWHDNAMDDIHDDTCCGTLDMVECAFVGQVCVKHEDIFRIMELSSLSERRHGVTS